MQRASGTTGGMPPLLRRFAARRPSSCACSARRSGLAPIKPAHATSWLKAGLLATRCVLRTRWILVIVSSCRSSYKQQQREQSSLVLMQGAAHVQQQGKHRQHGSSDGGSSSRAILGWLVLQPPNDAWHAVHMQANRQSLLHCPANSSALHPVRNQQQKSRLNRQGTTRLSVHAP